MTANRSITCTYNYNYDYTIINIIIILVHLFNPACDPRLRSHWSEPEYKGRSDKYGGHKGVGASAVLDAILLHGAPETRADCSTRTGCTSRPGHSDLAEHKLFLKTDYLEREIIISVHGPWTKDLGPWNLDHGPFALPPRIIL
jgi:hypothetical protein